MDSNETCSNTRLCTVFEMLIGRLDSLGDQITAVQAEQALQRRGLCHADSLRPLGTPFSGYNLLGVEVALTLHTPFDESGDFTKNLSCVFVDTESRIRHPNVRSEDLCALLKEREIIQAWGAAKCDGILARLTAGDPILSKELTELMTEISWIKLLPKHPSVRCRGGTYGGVILNVRGIKEAHAVVTSIVGDLGVTSRGLAIHPIQHGLEALAEAFTIGSTEDIKQAFEAISFYDRECYFADHSFFTKSRLMHLHGW